MKEAGEEIAGAQRTTKRRREEKEKNYAGLGRSKESTSKEFLKRHKAFIFNYLVFTQV